MNTHTEHTVVSHLSTLEGVADQYRVNPTPVQMETLAKMEAGEFGFPPNEFQKAFYEHLIGTRLNLGLNAKAGTGKTTTIEASVQLLLPQIRKGKKVLFLAFNKSIAEELRGRFAEKQYPVDVATVHSQGFRAIRYALSQKAKKAGYTARQIKGLDNLKIEGTNFRNYVRAAFQTEVATEDGATKFNYSELQERFEDVVEFEALDYVSTIVKLGDYARMYLDSSVKGMERIAGRFGLDIQADEIAQARQLLKDYTARFFKFVPAQGAELSIDFTDMLWLPNVGKAKYAWTFKQYDYVYIDEAQDLSTAQRTLVQAFVKSTGRLIFVGDPNQAIYGFAGADSDSYQKLTEIANTKVLPLNLCYRCGSNLIKEAQAFVPDIVAHKSTGRGEVRKGAISEIKRGDIIIGRTTAPLVALCLFLIRNRVQATVLGSNIGEGLIAAVKSTRKKNTVEAVIDHLWAKYDRVVERLVATNKADTKDEATELPQATLLEAKIETLQVIADESGATTPRQLIAEIKKIFSEKAAAVTLMTAHKSKGLEAETVHILDWEEEFPSKWAKSKEDAQQEANLQYVALTRGKKNLRFIYTPEFWADVEPPKIRKSK